MKALSMKARILTAAIAVFLLCLTPAAAFALEDNADALQLGAAGDALQTQSSASVGFDDVSGHWVSAEGWLSWVSQEGLMSGYSGTSHFGPDDDLTRAQAVTILYRFSLPDSAATTDASQYADNSSGLPDNKSKQYYTAAVNWAVAEGVVTGYRNDAGEYYAFGPDDPVTREQLATILCRFAVGKSDGAAFRAAPDAASVSDWAVDGVGWAFGNGVMTGDASTKALMPGGHASRAAMAKMSTVVLRDIVPAADAKSREELAGIKEVCDGISGVQQSFSDGGYVPQSNVEAALEAVEAYLGGVNADCVERFAREDGCVWVNFKNGMHFVYVPNVRGVLAGSGECDVVTVLPFHTPSLYAEAVNPSTPVKPGEKTPAQYRAEFNAVKIKATDYEKNGFVDALAAYIGSNLDACKVKNTFHDDDVTVDVMKGFGKNEVVLYEGHGVFDSVVGSTLMFNANVSGSYKRASEIADNENNPWRYFFWPLFLSDQVFSPADRRLVDDFRNKRLVMVNQNAAVTGSFVDYYYSTGSLEGAFIYLGACESLKDCDPANGFSGKGLAQAFSEKGAVLVGNRENAEIAYQVLFRDRLIYNMVAGKSLAEAFNAAVLELGDHDDSVDYPTWPKYYPDSAGSFTLVKATEQQRAYSAYCDKLQSVIAAHGEPGIAQGSYGASYTTGLVYADLVDFGGSVEYLQLCYYDPALNEFPRDPGGGIKCYPVEVWAYDDANGMRQVYKGQAKLSGQNYYCSVVGGVVNHNGKTCMYTDTLGTGETSGLSYSVRLYGLKDDGTFGVVASSDGGSAFPKEYQVGSQWFATAKLKSTSRDISATIAKARETLDYLAANKA